MDIKKIKSRSEFIKNLDLAVSSESILSIQRSAPTYEEEEDTAYVVGGSTVSYVGGVSAQQQQDVNNSTLLAALAANYQYDRETQTEDWYRYYQNVLENLGWDIQSFGFARYTEDDKSIKLDKSALAIISAMASGNELTVLEQTLEALEDSNPDSDQVSIFESNGSEGEAGNFQLSTASTDMNGNVNMALGAFYFKATTHKNRFLFITWESQSISLYFSASRILLVEEIYATVRQDVIDALGDNAQNFVANLQLAD